jgi:hypothetical protein
VELPRRLRDGAAAEAVARLEALQSSVKRREGRARRPAEALPQLPRRQRALDADREQRRMLAREAAEDEAGVDEVRRRVVRLGQGGHGRTQEVEGARPERDDQPVLGAEEAVDGARRGPRVVRHRANRERRQAPGLDRALRDLEQRRRGGFIVLTRSSHG